MVYKDYVFLKKNTGYFRSKDLTERSDNLAVNMEIG